VPKTCLPEPLDCLRSQKPNHTKATATHTAKVAVFQRPETLGGWLMASTRITPPPHTLTLYTPSGSLLSQLHMKLVDIFWWQSFTSPPPPLSTHILPKHSDLRVVRLPLPTPPLSHCTRRPVRLSASC
jgi:hypothetical protein